MLPRACVPRVFIPRVLSFKGPMFHRSYIPRVLCSQGPMFNRFYRTLCHVNVMCHIKLWNVGQWKYRTWLQCLLRENIIHVLYTKLSLICSLDISEKFHLTLWTFCKKESQVFPVINGTSTPLKQNNKMTQGFTASFSFVFLLEWTVVKIFFKRIILLLCYYQEISQSCI